MAGRHGRTTAAEPLPLVLYCKYSNLFDIITKASEALMKPPIIHGKVIASVALACILLLGLLTACSGQQAVPSSGSEPAGEPLPAPSESHEGNDRDEADGDVAEPEQDTLPDHAATDGETPGPEQDEQQPEPSREPVKTHYMNHNFFVKPVAEDGDKRVVLLTFDDGPKEEEMLVSMLDTLDRHEARAIFFVNGFRVKQNPDLLKLIDERGHAVGNHSYEHIVLRDEPEDVIDRQLADVQAIVEETIGKAPRFFRPPNGAGNDYVREKAKQLGMMYMNWSNGSLDWADNYNDPEGVIRSVMDQLNPGSIILMHELPWTAEALDDLLTQIRAEGYSFLDPEALEEEVR